MGALAQVFDAAGAATGAEVAMGDGEETGGADTAAVAAATARTRSAEAENAKGVVLQLLLALGREGEGSVDCGESGGGDMAMAERGGDQKRAEFVRGLHELAERMGIRSLSGERGVVSA